MGKLNSKINEGISLAKKYWNAPAEGNYVSYKEVASIGAAGFGVHWTSTLASAIGLSAANFLVGASIGLQPIDLSIMSIIANIIGIPAAIFRGWFLDNHKLPGGKFIPIITRTALPLVLLPAIMVWLPFERWEYVTKAIVVLLFFIVIQFFSCLYGEGWGFFQQAVTPNTQERANVMSIFQIIYSLAPTLTNLIIPTIAAYTFGLNNIWTYRIIYPGFTVVGLVILLIFFPKCKERIVMPKRRTEYISIIDSVREVAKNKYFWIINSAGWVGFLEGSYGAILGWQFVYGNGGNDEKYYGLAQTLISNAALWSMMVTPLLIKKMGKRNLLILHNALNIVLFSLLLPSFENIFLVCVIFYLNTFVNTFQNIYMQNIQADMRDHHQWKTGVRVDGLFGPLGLIGTVLGFATGLVVPAIYEYMGLKDDYNVLYDDTLRNNLFRVLIVCSIIGAVLNLIPYLFYDLTEAKHRGYVNVLKIRAMFADFGNNELDERDLIEGMRIIKSAREADMSNEIKIDKSNLKLAGKMPHKTQAEKLERKEAIKKARAEIREIKAQKEFCESLPIVIEELYKFETKRYKIQLTEATKAVNNGMIFEYDNYKMLLAEARALPHKTQEEKEIRNDAISLARSKRTATKLLRKFGRESLIEPNADTLEALQTAESSSLKDTFTNRKNLKAYTKGVSRYRRVTAPYENAKNLIIQAENYTKFNEVEMLYEEALARTQAD